MKRPRVKPPGGTRRRRQLSPALGETERVALWLSAPMARRLRLYCAGSNVSLSVAVEESLAEYLGRRHA